MLREYIAYLRDNPEHYWFKAKPYGWGWTPVMWQGWAVIGAYIVAMTLLAFTIDDSTPTEALIPGFVLPTVLLTGLLIYICYRTGEKPHWRWGFPKKYK